jgi:hypothetical protein
MRYPLLDGFRGFFLLFMMIIHSNEVLDTVLGKLNHHYFGWVQDAQGFVFISGFVVALVYGRAFDRGGFEACVRATYSRIRTIYTYQAGLILILLTVAVLVPVALQVGPFGVYQREPVWFTMSSLLLTSASMHMGILPMYIYFMAFLPFVLVVVARGHWPAVLLVSLLLWLAGQTRLLPSALDLLQSNFQAAGIDISLGLFFNLLSWQILFFGGALLGYGLNRNSLPLHWFQAPQARAMAVVASVAILVLGVFNRLVYWDFFSPTWTLWFLEVNERRHFGPLHLIAFLIALYFVAWLLLAANADRNPVLRTLHRVAYAIFSYPRLIFLGQHSLQAFAFHLLVVYALHIAFRNGPPNELLGTLVLIGCVLSLYLPAQLHAMQQKRKKVAATRTASQ